MIIYQPNYPRTFIINRINIERFPGTQEILAYLLHDIVHY